MAIYCPNTSILYILLYNFYAYKVKKRLVDLDATNLNVLRPFSDLTYDVSLATTHFIIFLLIFYILNCIY